MIPADLKTRLRSLGRAAGAGPNLPYTLLGALVAVSLLSRLLLILL